MKFRNSIKAAIVCLLGLSVVCTFSVVALSHNAQGFFAHEICENPEVSTLVTNFTGINEGEKIGIGSIFSPCGSDHPTTETEINLANEAVSHASGENTPISLLIPSIEEVLKYGYPVNDYGETYGPDVKEFDFSPDLILVRHGDSYGYVRRSELNDDEVTTPEEAVARMQDPQPRKISVYLQDGITCIGTFELKEGCSLYE